MFKIIWVWFRDEWMRAGLVAATFLFALGPLLLGRWDAISLLVYLHLPVYMVHQAEEHIGDRFRLFVNARTGGGRDVLPTTAVVVINVPGVWGLGLVSLYAMRSAGEGLGLMMVYLTLINALTHIVAACIQRAANPGLWSALFLFLPLSTGTLWAAARQPSGTIFDQASGLAVALLIHAAIVAYVLRRKRILPRTV
jgi:hypothetical protein